MAETIVSKQLAVSGMTCGGCALKIEKTLKRIDGVQKVKADYASGTVSIAYDESKVRPSKIRQVITALDYVVTERHAKPRKKPDYTQLVVITILVLGMLVLLNHFGFLQIFNYFPEARRGMSYATIFVLGLLSSVHCIGMCGGICLSQCVGTKGGSRTVRLRPSLLYNLGRILSYTVVGGLVGALGSVISLTGVMRGAVALFAGVMMILMGLNMLDLFPWLRKLSVRLPAFLTGGIEGKSNSPFYVGMMNGLMPCGPLQAMQLYALSTGSPLQGAISMFLFAFGTSFLMFGFGAVSALLSKKFTATLMTVSAVLVIVLGASMFNTGLSQSGFLGVGTAQSQPGDFQPVMQDGYQVVTIEVSPRAYGAITVQKDIPVLFNLHVEAENLNGCNRAIMIPKLGITQQLVPGDNIVSFTPTETGVIPYSCWMNMIRSSITVVA